MTALRQCWLERCRTEGLMKVSAEALAALFVILLILTLFLVAL